MKKSTYLGLTMLILCLTSCALLNNSPQQQLAENRWELVYISGPKIAFSGLYPDKKPRLSFDLDTKKVSGNNSCNGYSADFTLHDQLISFGEPGPTTMMFCGDGETQFLATMKKINAYRFDEEGNLELLLDEIPMLRFTKIAD